MKMRRDNGSTISSEEVNFLVFRYLQESGFAHTAFTFAYESQITKSSVAEAQVAPGMLITFLQKGLAYVGIEEHLNEAATSSSRRCPVLDEFVSCLSLVETSGANPRKLVMLEDGDGSEVRCDMDFSLLKAHVCGVKAKEKEKDGDAENPAAKISSGGALDLSL